MAKAGADPLLPFAFIIGLLGVGVAATASAKKKKRKKKCKRGAYPKLDPKVVQATVEKAIQKGWRTEGSIAIAVALQIQPKKPGTNIDAMYPPPQTDSAATCWYAELAVLISAILKERSIPPFPKCPPATRLEGDFCEPGINIVQYESPGGVPAPGHFYQVQQGNRLLGEDPNNSIIFQMLGLAAFEAARKNGLDEAAANEFATQVATNPQLRIDVLELISASPWNDALYATYGYGTKAVPSSRTGRALRMLPSHAPVREALISAQAPIRNIVLGTPADKLKGNAGPLTGSLRSYSYLWLPRLSLDALFKGQVSALGDAVWADGTPGSSPPPEVMGLGLPAAPEGVVWGGM